MLSNTRVVISVLLAGLVANFAVGGNTSIQSNICASFPTPPTISAPANGTSVSQPEAMVSGTADANTAIEIDDNGVAVANLTSDSSGNFGVSINLTPGQNQLIAKARNICNDEASSTPVIIIYTVPVTPQQAAQVQQAGPIFGAPAKQRSSNAPQQVAHSEEPSASAGQLILTIDSPRTITTSQPSITISGHTNQPASITIFDNGKKVASFATGPDGSFQVLVPLVNGLNKVVIVATAGTSSASIDMVVTKTVNAPAGSSSSFLAHNLGIIVTLATFVLGLIASLGVVWFTNWKGRRR